MMKIAALSFFILVPAFCRAQTFFETSEDDGVIAFRSNSVSQIKLNFSSTSLGYGYYFINGDSADPNRFLSSAEVKVTPNEDGIAKIMEDNELQPGITITGSVGNRFNDNILKNRSLILDVFFKPEYSFTIYELYDTTRSEQDGQFYKKNKHTIALNAVVNGFTSFGQTNLYFGIQSGISFSDNVDDFDDVTIETVKPYQGQPGRQVVSDVESAKKGQYKDVTKIPFKVDVVFDPNFELNKTDNTSIKLGLLAYYRKDFNHQTNVNRLGVGLCLLDAKNPSKIFSSIGYELPKFGNNVPESDKGKGIVFASIGYTIL